uniref:DPPIV_N domain-containing protein n=1 Tax=Heterorhabditis bacteriophora TaxID=37862 RepID=A0A1I7XG03_HETBA
MRKPLILLCLLTLAPSAIIPEKKKLENTKRETPETVRKFDDNSENGFSYANSPPNLPSLTRAEKWDLIKRSGRNLALRKRPRHTVRKVRKSKRDILLSPWRITHLVPRRPPPPKAVERPAVALSVDFCPKKFDAITRGYNGRTYVFARDRVYQMWYEDDLPQKASYLITELFPGGPRSVTAALTNSRSGVTVLIENRTAYRFRWNRKHKRFQLARNTPQELPRNVTISTQAAFEWVDGNQVILLGDQFIIYDAYWNLATFTGDTKKYFPNLPKDLLGIIYNGGNTLLMYTKNNKLKV